jgi:hypothetical protein
MLSRKPICQDSGKGQGATQDIGLLLPVTDKLFGATTLFPAREHAMLSCR